MKNSEMKRNCFCCEKELGHAGPADSEDCLDNPPDNATYWTTCGNYGSTVFDGGELTGEQLELFICDECLKQKANHVYHYRVVPKKREIKDLKNFSQWNESNYAQMRVSDTPLNTGGILRK